MAHKIKFKPPLKSHPTSVVPNNEALNANQIDNIQDKQLKAKPPNSQRRVLEKLDKRASPLRPLSKTALPKNENKPTFTVRIRHNPNALNSTGELISEENPDDQNMRLLNEQCFKDLHKCRKIYELQPHLNASGVYQPDFDEYIYCFCCKDYSYLYCRIHKPPLFIADDKIIETEQNNVPRAMRTIPSFFLTIKHSTIPGAGLGVFTNVPIPKDTVFGPYCGVRTNQPKRICYSWEILNTSKRERHVIDASDPNNSNWLRYVNCSRYEHEQNLVAFQFKGNMYYRTMVNVPVNKELLVFYGVKIAYYHLGINIALYNVIPEPLLRCDTKPEVYKQIINELQSSRPLENAKQCNVDMKCLQIDNIHKSFQQDPIISKVTSNDNSIKLNRAIFEPENKINGNSFFGECQYCNRRFGCKISIVKHINIHITKQTCKSCNLLFNTEPEFIDHVLQFHEKSKQLSKLQIRKEKPYTCNVCDKSFSWSSSLQSHLRIHTKEKPYTCNVCDKSFSWSSALQSHLRIHTKEKPYTCNVCDKSFSRISTLQSHLRIHTKEKPYTCNVCDKSFSQSSTLQSHLRIHTKEKPYTCNVCDKSFSSSSALQRHLRIHTKEKLYTCNVCDKSFSSSSALQSHLRIHTKEKPYTCNVCDISFSWSSALQSHLRIHTKEKPYTCNVCDKSFSSSSALQRHLRIHTKEKLYTCNVCDKSFSQSSTLQSHLRIHTKEKPYTCNVCDKSFSRISTLQSHLRTHTKEKPYTCNVCDKSFSQSSTLQSHLRIHTKEKPYTCNVCDKSFSWSSSLQSHLRIHTKEKPYTCNVCDKSFSRISTLQSHLRIHTKEKPYTCNVCDKSFSWSSSLQSHLRIHTKEKPYTCNVCDKSFSQSFTLQRHLCLKIAAV